MTTITSNILLPNYNPEEVGLKGEKGDDGKTSFIHIAYSNSSDGGVDFSTTDSTNRSFMGSYSDFEMIDSTDPSKYEWQRVKGDSGKDGIAGKDGVGLKSTSITYAASTSASTAPYTGWTAQVPNVAEGSYLWTKTVWNYTDSTSETGYSVARMGADGDRGQDGIAGKDGVGIKSTLVEYVVSVTGTNAPASGWSTTIPVTPEGQFLWTRTKWTYTDNTTEIGYSVAKQGAKGATGSTGAPGQNGVGIASTIIDYNKSTSSTETPTTGWTSSIPSISGGEYLWTRTTLNYTNSTKAVSYTISRQGEDGSDGQLFTGEFAPTKFNEDDLWYKVVSGKVIGVFKATSGQWIEVPFESSVIAETIVGKTIQASNLTGSTIDGGKISGAEFVNNFTFNESDQVKVTGQTSIVKGKVGHNSTGTVIDPATGEARFKGYESYYSLYGGQMQMQNTSYSSTGDVISAGSALLTGDALMLTLSDSSGVYAGRLTAKALSSTPWINIRINSNFEVKENNTPAYRIVYQLDGTRKIEFKGQVGPKPSSGISINKDGSYYPFQGGTGTTVAGDTYVPTAITPNQTEFAYTATNKGSGGRIAITNTPRIIFIPAETLGQATAAGGSPYFSLSSLSYTIA